MSITLAKLTTEIAAHLGKELDEPFKRLLAEKVDSWRSRLIRNSLQDKPNEAHNFRQTIYIPLKSTSPLPQCVGDIEICPVRETTLEVPEPIRYSGVMYDFIGAMDGFEAFLEAAPGTGEFLQAGKYSKRKVFWTKVNRKIQLRNALAVPFLRIDTVFDKPLEAMELNCSAGFGCDFWDAPYPITGDIAQMVVQSILQVDFNRPATPASKEVDVNAQKQEHAPDGR